jgi:uncharacterized membrane protein YkvA (DUF1232 family)
MQKRPSQGIVPAQSNMFKDTVLRIKLIVRLIGDRRVSPWLKILPIGGILYLFSPLDIVPDIAFPIIGELDDLAILWLTNHFFIELCPPEIVREHVKNLVSNSDIIEEERNKAAANEPDIIDGEATDITDRKP